MRKLSKSTLFVRLALFGVAMLLVALCWQPVTVEAATCPTSSCGNWTYYGCCGSHLYQQRTCCNGPTCCSQFRCTTGPCIF